MVLDFLLLENKATGFPVLLVIVLHLLLSPASTVLKPAEHEVAHNLCEVFPSERHAAVAVDLRRVVQNVGRLVREKVRRECPCAVSGSARCTTWHARMKCFRGETQRCASILSHAGAWRSMCDCTL